MPAKQLPRQLTWLGNSAAILDVPYHYCILSSAIIHWPKNLSWWVQCASFLSGLGTTKRSESCKKAILHSQNRQLNTTNTQNYRVQRKCSVCSHYVTEINKCQLSRHTMCNRLIGNSGQSYNYVRLAPTCPIKKVMSIINCLALKIYINHFNFTALKFIIMWKQDSMHRQYWKRTKTKIDC